MRINSKWFVVLMVALLSLALVVSGCGGKKADDKTIKIGVMAPMTGDVKTFGESTVNGVKLAIEQAGGMAGDYKIEYVVADDRNDATEAVNAATKLISQDMVDAIVGSVTSKASIPVSKMANDSKIVMISPTGTNEKITVEDGKRKDFIFRACYIDPVQGNVAAKFALEKLNKKTAAILYDQSNDYTIGLGNSFKETFEKGGGKVTDLLAYSSTDADFNAIITNIAQKNPDIIYLPDYYQKVGLIGKQAREKGIKSVFLGGDGWDSPELDYTTMEGSYFTNHYSAEDPDPRKQDFVKLYKEKYKSVPDFCAVEAYDATNILINAIKNANSKDHEAIRKAMQETKDFKAVTDDINFDKNGNPTKSITILQIKDGKQSYMTTVTP